MPHISCVWTNLLSWSCLTFHDWENVGHMWHATIPWMSEPPLIYDMCYMLDLLYMHIRSCYASNWWIIFIIFKRPCNTFFTSTIVSWVANLPLLTLPSQDLCCNGVSISRSKRLRAWWVDIYPKVNGPHSITHLKETPIFKWYVVCGSKNGH